MGERVEVVVLEPLGGLEGLDLHLLELCLLDAIRDLAGERQESFALARRRAAGNEAVIPVGQLLEALLT
ncbi:hypothetical protein D3C72_2490990 [compost metagenome]